MSTKLKIYQFDLKGVEYADGVQLIAAESKDKAQIMANERTADGGEWAFNRLRNDIVTTRKKPYRVLHLSYIE